ncbi:type III secretion system chaperone [Methylocystis echinoides]|uniref:Tir chaperone family protein n=1 Tax=Methylocystis echinoides TaxID=29468 RepID=A0A9W6LQU3_9HYPH|nr:type III secretion system chaperone [Methylocystis echinoides]GLI91823.1 hypothetical protein LMG27198_08150 [Methylocystis echinoides]
MRNAIEALESLGAQIGLAGLGFDKDGVCGLIVGDDTEIFFYGEPDGEILRLSGIIGDIDDERPALAQRLLELNAGDGENGAAAFAVDPDTGEIMLVRVLTLSELSPESLLAAVEEFVVRVEYWTENLPHVAVKDEAAAQALLPDAMIILG